MLIAIIGIVLLLVGILMRVLLLRRKNVPAGLFYTALKNENDGHYEEALANYEMALTEAKKNKSNKDLKIKITEKIKVLHTVIEYEKGLFYLKKTYTDQA